MKNNKRILTLKGFRINNGTRHTPEKVEPKRYSGSSEKGQIPSVEGDLFGTLSQTGL